jgi:two-component system CheB/CheR fusion protein
MPISLNVAVASFNYFDALFKYTKQNTVLLINEKGIITEVNNAFTNSFGYTNDEIIGKEFKILFTPEDQKKGLPETEINTVLQEGQCKDNTYLVHKNETITWVSGESILVKNLNGEISILKIIQDIHTQKTYENFSRRLHDFNENILKSIEDVIIVVNEEMKINKANDAFFKLFTGDEADINSLNFADLIKPYDSNDDLRNSLQQAIKTGTGFLHKEIEITTISEGKKMFDISCRIVDGIEQKNGLLVLHDITAQIQSQRQREDIIGFVAHELRNPLANIVLCNEIMGETLNENNITESQELLARSKSNVMRLSKMIADLYDATKVGSETLQLEKAVFNFEEMINEAVDTIKALQPSYKISVKGHANIDVHGDRYRLIQVVTNYLSNGIKYSEGNAEVVLNMDYENKDVTVYVKDAGLGIKKDQLPYIFNRFYRAEKTKNLEGIGLGLYLCSKIIKAHNGRIWAESEEGKGSTFYFSIPILHFVN